jgi:hypothetical protein
MHDEGVPFGAAFDFEDASYARAICKCPESVDRFCGQYGEVAIGKCSSGLAR